MPVLVIRSCPLSRTCSTLGLNHASVNLFLELEISHLRCVVDIRFGHFLCLRQGSACIYHLLLSDQIIRMIKLMILTLSTSSVLCESRITLRRASRLRDQDFCSIRQTTQSSFSVVVLHDVAFDPRLLHTHNGLVWKSRGTIVTMSYWTFRFIVRRWACLQLLLLESVRS